MAFQKCQTLREAGTALHRELFPHITKARQSTLGLSRLLPDDYLQRTEKWQKQFFAFAGLHLTEQEMTDVAPHPPMWGALLGGPDAALIVRDKFDAMFKTNLGLLDRIEARL